VDEPIFILLPIIAHWFRNGKMFGAKILPQSATTRDFSTTRGWGADARFFNDTSNDIRALSVPVFMKNRR
jgi:hypothetical protein